MNDISHIDPQKIKTRMILDNYDDSYHTIYDSVILTCYMTSKPDPQRNIFQENNSYEYIKPWYESMKMANIHGIIFYDKLSKEFIDKYQTDKIIFKKCKLGLYSINDERFIIYYQYLLKNPYKYVSMTDVSDVTVNNDPANLMRDPAYENKLFVGTNVIGMGALKRTPMWFDRRAWKIDPINLKLKESGYDTVGYQKNTIQIYSAGLIGGSYNNSMWLLSKMIEIMLIIDSVKNNNMIILNYIINRYLLEDYDTKTFCTKYIHTGQPFNNRFADKKETKAQKLNCCLVHK